MVERRLYMKATGVVRRIDDLGRIVIPKEIRRTFKINEGDSLEIFVDDNEIILKKYSLMDNMMKLSMNLVDIVWKVYNKKILITNREKVIATTKELSDCYQNHELTSTIKEQIEKRSEVISEKNFMIVMDDDNISSYFLLPIIVNSDSIGSVILIFDEEVTEEDKNIVRFLNSILVKNIEQ